MCDTCYPSQLEDNQGSEGSRLQTLQICAQGANQGTDSVCDTPYSARLAACVKGKKVYPKS
eukprot:m.213643 g.213643  ORF g.213643 m.213643 type:complete len:61 (+) comp15524_c0_seq10:1211-1393(+)